MKFWVIFMAVGFYLAILFGAVDAYVDHNEVKKPSRIESLRMTYENK